MGGRGGCHSRHAQRRREHHPPHSPPSFHLLVASVIIQPNHNMASGVAAVSTDAMGSPFVGVRWVPAIHAFSLAIKVVLQAFGEAVATEVRR